MAKSITRIDVKKPDLIQRKRVAAYARVSMDPVRRAVPGRGAGISDCSAEDDVSGGRSHVYAKVSQDP